eukprot:CAMPEP_0175117354 /NCGR_PEP_ID=MMETSP0086_2-20121207/18830_1 /TAXON_ID=136419 /ORGANISM="Unknown Unknown, Strain D1" /LENGTH=38 /DNA_ID= /DNA_START= /DNA_END= /DNA_ORIENTATION=
MSARRWQLGTWRLSSARLCTCRSWSAPRTAKKKKKKKK